MIKHTRILLTRVKPPATASEVIHPMSYCSEKGSERLKALTLAEQNPQGIWALKPSKGLGGKGIQLVRSADLREKLFPKAMDVGGTTSVSDGGSTRRTTTVVPDESTSSQTTGSSTAPESASETTSSTVSTRTNSKANSPPPRPPTEAYIIQEYIEKPLLLNGRKFDIRVYCLIARTDPALWFFHSGYCKVALEPYHVDGSRPLDLNNLFAHLTNASIQKQHPEYKNQRGSHIWSYDKADADLRKQNRLGENESMWPLLHERMKKCFVYLYEASKGSLQRKPGFFDLLGADFMLDEDMKVVFRFVRGGLHAG